MDALEVKICQALAERGPSVTGDSDKSKALFKSLADRGYVKLGRGRCGPLGVYAGDTVATLTEAGRIAIQPTAH